MQYCEFFVDSSIRPDNLARCSVLAWVLVFQKEKGKCANTGKIA